MSVAEVSRATRISTTALERIEADHFDDLPGEVFTRGFLKAYATTVGLPPNEVLARYTAARRSVAVEPLPLATPVQRSGARRFGFAVAFVVLVVLFTLALSMVLRPRGHDRPPELSQHPAQLDDTLRGQEHALQSQGDALRIQVGMAVERAGAARARA